MPFSSSLELNFEMYYCPSPFLPKGPILGVFEENIYIHDRRMNWLQIRNMVQR
jgi:hypothetical protein